LILLETNVKMAKVLALSKCTYFIGGGLESSGFDAPITALK
jgi:hypothetical protein